MFLHAWKCHVSEVLLGQDMTALFSHSHKGLSACHSFFGDILEKTGRNTTHLLIFSPPPWWLGLVTAWSQPVFSISSNLHWEEIYWTHLMWKSWAEFLACSFHILIQDISHLYTVSCLITIRHFCENWSNTVTKIFNFIVLSGTSAFLLDLAFIVMFLEVFSCRFGPLLTISHFGLLNFLHASLS